LLEGAREAVPLRPILLGAGGRRLQQEVADEAQHAEAHERVAQGGAADRRLHVPAVQIARALLADVRPVDGEAGDDFTQGIAQGIEGEVAGGPALLGELVELMREHVELARERRVENQHLLLVRHLGERQILAGDGPVERGERLDLPAVDEEAVDLVEELVPARPVHRPRLDERLTRGEDLLRHDEGHPALP
jgi:hypothetical protein